MNLFPGPRLGVHILFCLNPNVSFSFLLGLVLFAFPQQISAGLKEAKVSFYVFF